MKVSKSGVITRKINNCLEMCGIAWNHLLCLLTCAFIVWIAIGIEPVKYTLFRINTPNTAMPHRYLKDNKQKCFVINSYKLM